jgi:hypothetical protein
LNGLRIPHNRGNRDFFVFDLYQIKKPFPMEVSDIKTHLCKRITARLAGLRIACGYKANRVRDDTRIDINKIERNESNLTVFTLYKLLRYYGKSMSDFFSEMGL